MKKDKKPIQAATVNPQLKNLRYLTCSYKYAGKHPVPYIRLIGKWLQNAGFEIGSIVSIEEKDNSLVITRVPAKWKIEHIVKKTAVDDAGNTHSLK